MRQDQAGYPFMGAFNIMKGFYKLSEYAFFELSTKKVWAVKATLFLHETDGRGPYPQGFKNTGGEIPGSSKNVWTSLRVLNSIKGSPISKIPDSFDSDNLKPSSPLAANGSSLKRIQKISRTSQSSQTLPNHSLPPTTFLTSLLASKKGQIRNY